MDKKMKVCVTGAAGYLGSYLVKKLLEKGYIVHATTRNLGDTSKVGLLKSLPNAETGLRLFEADIYNSDQFKYAIQGCEIVVHLATPLIHEPQSSQFKDTSEAAVAGVKSIVESCIKAGTVKRLIYTASVVASSPMKEDGLGFKDSMNESCWTPINLSFPNSPQAMTAYTRSKTLSEQEVLRHNREKLEVVSITCGLVGGGTVHSAMSQSMGILISQVTEDKVWYPTLRQLEDIIGKLPIVHIEDVREAHIFCIEKPSVSGRFLCAKALLSSAEIANYWQKKYPHIAINGGFVENLNREIVLSSTKLKELGFEYKHGVEKILDDTLKCAQELGQLSVLTKPI